MKKCSYLLSGLEKYASVCFRIFYEVSCCFCGVNRTHLSSSRVFPSLTVPYLVKQNEMVCAESDRYHFFILWYIIHNSCLFWHSNIFEVLRFPNPSKYLFEFLLQHLPRSHKRSNLLAIYLLVIDSEYSNVKKTCNKKQLIIYQIKHPKH